MTELKTYQVTLTYAKGGKYPDYQITIEAASQNQAIRSAEIAANYEGWPATPLRSTAKVIDHEQE